MSNLGNTFGPNYDEQRDGTRVRNQMKAVLTLMQDERWRTLSAIARTLHYPEASVSAQLRHLRKPRFGGYRVEKRNKGGGVWEYRVLPPLESNQPALLDPA